MSVFVFGVNYAKAPIAVREHLAFSKTALPHAIQSLKAMPGLNEVVLVSTCNRIEIYYQANEPLAIDDWFVQDHAISLSDLQSISYHYDAFEAVSHLLSVACGLDSMVLGESQILGQLKLAYKEACLAGSVGRIMGALFRQAFTVAKKVRTTTAIGACPVSVASTALSLVKMKNPSLNWSQSRIVLVGAGETNALLIKHLVALQPCQVSIVSRHMESAQKLCQYYPATAYTFKDLKSVLKRADVVFSATASEQAVVTADHFAICSDRKQPMTIVDMAVPRDVEIDVTQYDFVHLYNIDDLKQAIQVNLNVREHAALRAKEMIEEKAKAFMLSLRSLEVAPVIKRYRNHIEQLREYELSKALQAIEKGLAPEEVLLQFSRGLANKVMHLPCTRIKQASVEDRQDVLHFVNELFATAEE